jgi:hypothetical protein
LTFFELSFFVPNSLSEILFQDILHWCSSLNMIVTAPNFFFCSDYSIDMQFRWKETFS